MSPNEHEKSITPELWRLLRIWLLLLLLGAAEFGASFLSIPGGLRPVIMILGLAMILTVALGFMEVKRGVVLVRAFAVAAMFWLLVLLGLGSVDALTRTDYHVPNAHVK